MHILKAFFSPSDSHGNVQAVAAQTVPDQVGTHIRSSRGVYKPDNHLAWLAVSLALFNDKERSATPAQSVAPVLGVARSADCRPPGNHGENKSLIEVNS